MEYEILFLHILPLAFGNFGRHRYFAIFITLNPIIANAHPIFGWAFFRPFFIYSSSIGRAFLFVNGKVVILVENYLSLLFVSFGVNYL